MSKPELIKKEIVLEDGRIISLETGQLAKLADGAVVLRMGNTMLLATIVASQDAREGVDFLPLTVDYQEKYAAAGRFPGGFLKRESRLSDYEVLISRMVDRAIRPLFPDDFHAETQVMISLISADINIPSDCLAGLAASAAISISDIPFNGPISEVRVARIDGKFVINPYASDLERADLEIIVAGSEHDINMVEGEMSEVSEEDLIDALKFGHEEIKRHCKIIKELVAAVGEKPRREYDHEEPDDENLRQEINNLFADKLLEISRQGLPKQERSDLYKKLIDDYMEALPEESEISENLVKKYYNELKKEVVRNMVLTDRKRLDGRALDEIRPIWCEVDYLPSVHGSAIFTRGETQSLTTVTLGGKIDEQLIDDVMYRGYNKFLLHYNFPGFSTGEAKMNRGPGRREVGHGNLAMRALKKVLPEPENNPYTVRIVSDILESNGSSSMATVCAGCMAMMDAGLKLKAHVSGIAMGLISGKDGNYAVLSDILGDEDHLGDMDFKVTGTEKGITACQMDLKVDGLSYQVLGEALEQAKRGRLHILEKMKEAIPESREEFKPHAPRIEKFTIDKDFIGAVIGQGGKVIQQIQKETGATITIEERDNRGYVEILSPNKESIDAASKWIHGIIEIPEEGTVYHGKIVSIMDFGAFVEFLPSKQGLLHISEISWERLNSMEGVFVEGDTIEVKLIEVDQRAGKFRLSRKELLPLPEGMEKPERRPHGGGDRRGGGGRDRDRGGRRDDRRGGDRREGNGRDRR